MWGFCKRHFISIFKLKLNILIVERLINIQKEPEE